jgi:hypothetical protein
MSCKFNCSQGRRCTCVPFTANGGHRVDTFKDEEEDLALVTPGEIATWSVVLSLLAFLAVIFAALAAFHLVASLY